MPRETRKATNQEVFRELNEATAAFASGLELERSEIGSTYDFICECGEMGCTQPLPLTLDSYAKARRDPETFLVAAGHEDPVAEDVIGNVDGCLIVRVKAGSLTA